MRSFPTIYLLIFLLFYLFITIGTYKALIKIASKNLKANIKWIFWIYNLIIALVFIFLYIYPNQPRQATNYTPYLYFNVILFSDLLVKIILSLSCIPFLLLKNWEKRRVVLYTGLIFSVGIILNIIYGVTAGNRNIQIQRIEIVDNELPPNFDDFRIVQISDIHLGSTFDSELVERAQIKIDELNPDLIVFTGDLVNNFADETTQWIEDFKKMTANVPSYSILGNHDYGDYTSWESEKRKQNNFDAILAAQQQMGFRMLRNEHDVITKGDDSLYLVGVENWGHDPFPQYADMEKAMRNVPDNAFVILLTHDPAHWESKVKYNDTINLSFSGHTHGLQWGIKPAGIPFSLSYFTRKNWGGFYESGNSKLVVSTGLGSVGIPWRIDMPPEITVVTLKRLEID